MDKEQSLIIWFKNGSTGKFEKVKNFKHETAESGRSYLRFSYFGISTQVTREAVFYFDNIAGFAMEV